MAYLRARDDFLHVILRCGDFFPGASQPLDASPAKLLERLALAVLVENVLAAPAVSGLAFNELVSNKNMSSWQVDFLNHELNARMQQGLAILNPEMQLISLLKWQEQEVASPGLNIAKSP